MGDDCTKEDNRRELALKSIESARKRAIEKAAISARNDIEGCAYRGHDICLAGARIEHNRRREEREKAHNRINTKLTTLKLKGTMRIDCREKKKDLKENHEEI